MPGTSRKVVLGTLLILSALLALESTVITTAMPTIIGELRGIDVYSWAFSLYLLSTTLTMPVYGRAGDLLGRRKVLLFAIAVFLAGGLGCALAQSMPQLLIARFLQGVGGGGLMPLALAIAADLYTVRERARIQAYFSTVWGVASLSGPAVGAFLTLTFGWRSVFTVALPFGAAAFFASIWTLPPSRPKQSAPPLDTRGIVLMWAGIGCLLFSVLSTSGHGGLPPALRAVLALCSIFLLALFFLHEGRVPVPLIPLRLVNTRRRSAPYLAGLLLGCAVYGVETYVPLFVQGARGGTAASAGAVVTPIILMWSVSSVFGARGAVRFGFRRTAFAGGLLLTAGLLVLFTATLTSAPVLVFSLGCALAGSGLGPLSITQLLTVQQEASLDDRGVASSLVPFVRSLGGAVGVGSLGTVLSLGLMGRLGSEAEGLFEGGTAMAFPVHVQAALHSSLIPVFGILLLFAVFSVLVASWFPKEISS